MLAAVDETRPDLTDGWKFIADKGAPDREPDHVKHGFVFYG